MFSIIGGNVTFVKSLQSLNAYAQTSLVFSKPILTECTPDLENV